MATITQTPGTLDITVIKGDTLSIALDFSIDLTGYTFEAYAGTVSMTVTEVSLADGQINLAMSAAKTASLRDSTDWYLRWTDTGGAKRTVLRGRLNI